VQNDQLWPWVDRDMGLCHVYGSQRRSLGITLGSLTAFAEQVGKYLCIGGKGLI
jgi:hypothetical protein